MISLNDYARKIYSQRGEDGIIEKIFSELRIITGVAVELGAWDGIYLSNTFNLIEKGWSGILIESDAERFSTLTLNMKNFSRVRCINSFVCLSKESTLSHILHQEEVPFDFDLLSIDLDGIDYWVLCELQYRPKVIVCEYNSNWVGNKTVAYSEFFVWDGSQYFGASGEALNNLLDSRGYDCVAHIPNNNLIFLRRDFNKNRFALFKLADHKHVSFNHHRPMNRVQQACVIVDPPLDLY